MASNALHPGGAAAAAGTPTAAATPSATSAAAPSATSPVNANATPVATHPPHPPHHWTPPAATHIKPVVPGMAAGDPLYVLDANTGETLPANTTLNSFSTWSENLLAQVGGAAVTSYTWDTSQAPDLTNISGQNTFNLQGTWANFTGAARTDTITLTESSSAGQLSQTMTYLVAGTDSPAYSSRPTMSSTWANVITPDQITAGQATQPGGPYANLGLADGSVQTAFAMPSYNPNVSPLGMVYNSTAANDQPIFLVHYQLPADQPVPATIAAQLTLNGTTGATITYDTSSLNPGDWVQIALQGDATTLSTGRYAWQITVTNDATPTNYSGDVNLVNQANSPFGAGWSLDNVEQLVPVSGGVILVQPGGTSLWFASDGQGGYITPAGDFSTLVRNQDGTYTRTLTDGTRINFSSAGLQTSIVDRDGNTTTFGYNGANQLTTITDWNNQTTTLAYNASGQLFTITDPAMRTATLGYTGVQLTSITDPGNNLWQYAYDSANRLTTLNDPNNHATTFGYNFAGRVATVTRADTTTEQLAAEQVNGLAAPGTGTPANPAPAVLLAAGDQAQFTDGRQNVWTTGLDWLGFGMGTSDADPLGDTSLIYLTAAGLVWLTADGLGRRTRNFFDAKGNTTEVVAADDTTQQYQYNQFSEVTQYTDQENNVTTYTFNAVGDLTQKTDAFNDVTTYTNNSHGLLTGVTDPLHNTTTYSYDALNRLSSILNAMNGLTTFGYDNASNLTSSTDPRGFVTTYSYNALNRITGQTLPDTPGVFSTYTYGYDKVGNLTSVTDPYNHTTSYGFDALNRMTSVTDPLLHTTSYSFDAASNLIGVTNALNDTMTYSFDAANRMVSMLDPMNDQTTYGYDDANEETSLTDPMNNVKVYTYTPRGEEASETVYAPASGGSGGARKNVAKGAPSGSGSGSLGAVYVPVYEIDEKYYKCGCPLSITTVLTFPNSASGLMDGSISGGFQSGDSIAGNFSGGMSDTSFYFNDYGSIDGNNDPGGYIGNMDGAVNGNTLSGTFTLNGYSGNVSGTISGTTVSGTYRGNNISGSFSGTIQPSGAARLSPSGSGSGSGSSGETITYQRDALHRVTGVTDPQNNTTTYGYDANSNRTSVTDPLLHTTTYTFNAMNGLVGVTDPLNHTTTYGRDAAGNVTSITDPLLRQTTFAFDGQNRLLSQTASNGGVTNYAFDLVGNLTSLTDPNNNTTSYAFDAANRLTTKTDPFGKQTTYGYNAANWRTSVTDRNNRTIDYGFDAAGRETSETWVGGNYTATYAYNADSQLTSAQDPFSVYTYTYDALGNMTSVDNTGTPGVPQVTLNYGYDSFNNRTSLTDSLGGSLSYGYDSDNRLTSLGLSVSSTLEAQLTFGYDAASRLTGITRTAPAVSGDTITTSLSYDNANLLTNITHADQTKSLTLAGYTYGYDAANQLTSYQDGNSSLTYGYDKVGELTSASGTLAGSNYSASYSYDLNGNRNMPGYTTDKDNRLTSDGTYNYTYDNEGNTLTQTNIATGSVTYFTWDYRNRLTEEQVKDSHGNLLQDEKFTYDVNNNRIGVMLNGVQQLWTVFDGANPYMDFNGSGQLTQRYLTNPKGLSQFYGQVSASGATQWFLTDNLYSIRQVVDASGNSLYAVTYGPFGGILSQTNPANAPRFGYAGGAYDPVTGTWQFGRREENPADGRWLSQDPEGFTAGDDNLYRYVLNNFVSLRDPSGQDISIVVGNSGGTSNKLFHEDICVDTWELRDGTYVNTGKICFSFAKKTGLSSYSIHCGTTWLDSPSVKFCIWTGIVYSSSWSGKGTIHEVLHTSAGQDIEFLEYLQGLVGKEDGYSLLRHSCQTFSEQMYDEAKRRYGGVRGMPHDAELDPSLWDPSLQQFRIL